MSKDLMRFSVTMPEDLLANFDDFVAKRGLSKNRSEVIRDLVRDVLAADIAKEPGAEVVGTLTIMFDHHINDVREKLDAIQHDYLEEIVTSLHVHLSHNLCIEVIVIRGEASVVQAISNLIIGTKGVLNGSLSTIATGDNVFGEPIAIPSTQDIIEQELLRFEDQPLKHGSSKHTHMHAHGHAHAHGHSHDKPTAPKNTDQPK